MSYFHCFLDTELIAWHHTHTHRNETGYVGAGSVLGPFPEVQETREATAVAVEDTEVGFVRRKHMHSNQQRYLRIGRGRTRFSPVAQ